MYFIRKRLRHSSFPLKSRYINVSGCEKSGDVISLVSNFLSLSPFEAVVYLNDHFGLGLNLNNKKNQSYSEKKKSNAILNHYKQQKIQREYLKTKSNQAFQTLCDYLHSLEDKYEVEKENFTSIDDFFGKECISEYLQEAEKINYYINIFIYGTDEDKKWFLKTNGKVVKEYARRLEQ